MTPPAVVFDCMVYLQAAVRATGPARACLELARAGRIVLFLSPPIRAELVNVLNRPKLQEKFRTLTPEAVTTFLANVDALSTSTATVSTLVSLPRDPKDEPYVNLALAVGATYLVSWDSDLLDLMDETTASGTEFRQRFPGLTILNPVAFLRELRAQPQGPEAGSLAHPLD